MGKMPKYRKNAQRGVALIEAMISIIVLAIGVLGVLGLQLRTMVEAQQSANRALAVRLAEDFSERVKNNPGNTPNAGNLLATNFITGGWVDLAGIAAFGTDCEADGCDPQDLADWDQFQWLQNVLSTLPNAQVNVFMSTNEQLGILFAWEGNMRLQNNPADQTSTDYRAIYGGVTGQVFTGGGNIGCPPAGAGNAELVCHVVYVSY